MYLVGHARQPLSVVLVRQLQYLVSDTCDEILGTTCLNKRAYSSLELLQNLNVLS